MDITKRHSNIYPAVVRITTVQMENNIIHWAYHAGDNVLCRDTREGTEVCDSSGKSLTDKFPREYFRPLLPGVLGRMQQKYHSLTQKIQESIIGN